MYTRAAAPDVLERVETFCNSARFLYGEDTFAELESTRAWLRARAWDDAAEALNEVGRQELMRVREAIRENIEGDERGLSTLNVYAWQTVRPPQWAVAGEPLIKASRGSPIAVVIGTLLATLASEELAGRRDRLKVCRSPDCRWVFYDRSPGNNSVWCSMSICGARHKMRSYRTRRNDAGGPDVG